jgi:hypothetical protein
MLTTRYTALIIRTIQAIGAGNAPSSEGPRGSSG